MTDTAKQNREMRALLVRWNEAWKVAAIVDSGCTNVDVARINAETELFLEATAPEMRTHECRYCNGHPKGTGQCSECGSV